MLAPERPAMAAELLRVCRPGGVVAITNWLSAAFPPPEQAPPDPTDWAVPELVTTYFADLPATITTARRTIGVRWPSADTAAEMIEKGCGPLTGAVAALRENGDWPKARAAIVEMLEAEAGSSGGLTVDMPYLLTVARRDE